jgi:hypothetical protein
MRPLSATEAISPALNRTKAVLFQPFQWGRSWKLAATAYLSALAYFFLPTPLVSVADLVLPSGKPIALRMLSAVFGIVFSLVAFALFYIGARMEFVLFDVVLLQEKFVAPSWKRHISHTWRWIGLKLLLSLALAILFGPILFLAFRNLQHHMVVVPGQPPSPQFFAGLLSFYAAAGLPTMLAILLSSLLTNFVLPSIALEGTTAREAVRRFGELLGLEPGPVALFAVMKVLLAIAAVTAAEIAVMLASFLAAIPLGLIAFLGWLLLRSAGDAGHFMMLAGGVALFGIFAVLLIYFSTLAMGSVHTFFQAYALYFLGGRYPMLGNLLEPPAPLYPYAAPPPAFEPITPPPPAPAL